MTPEDYTRPESQVSILEGEFVPFLILKQYRKIVKFSFFQMVWRFIAQMLLLGLVAQFQAAHFDPPSFVEIRQLHRQNIPKGGPVPLSYLLKHHVLSKSITCPDHQSQCPYNNTCCPMDASESTWGCCSYPNVSTLS